MPLPTVTTTTNIPSAIFAGTAMSTSSAEEQKGSQLADIMNWYESSKADVEKLEAYLDKPGRRSAASYLFDGKVSLEHAVKSLDVDAWRSALNLTDAFELMSQSDAGEWRSALKNREVPAFERGAVVTTLDNLLNSRGHYFAKRVESVYKALSKKHVTNPAHAFGEKMILEYGFGAGEVCSTRAGYINDLRALLSMFVGADQPTSYSTKRILSWITSSELYGQWVDFDNGIFKIKLFKKGTAHIQVHPDLVWRLNATLASLYGAAIPEKFRHDAKAKSFRSAKFYQVREQWISQDVINCLQSSKEDFKFIDEFRDRLERLPNTITLSNSSTSKETLRVCENIVIACGGVKTGHYSYKFEYDFIGVVLPEILRNRTMPEQRSHQFYPTPIQESEKLIALADLKPEDEKLEPSAGTGNLAGLMGENTTCVEISELHCSVLKAKGLNAVRADFLEWSKSAPMFDKICANPPYSEGRAIRHVEAAMQLLKKNGVYVGLVPPTLKDKLNHDGYRYEWLDKVEDAFEGTGVTVQQLRITRL